MAPIARVGVCLTGLLIGGALSVSSGSSRQPAFQLLYPNSQRLEDARPRRILGVPHSNWCRAPVSKFSSSDSTIDSPQGLDEVERRKFRERHKYWVVLVDDEEAIRSAVGDFLYDSGYQVTACEDADALLEVCNTPKEEGQLAPCPNAIVSDIRMPGKDGIELLGLIRADDRLKRVPVILLTAKAMTQDRIEGFKAGADAYIPKPFNPDELLSVLDNSIQRQRQMKGESGAVVDLKEELADIKHLMRRNSAKLVKKTDVYLTLAEREVLGLLSNGYSNSEIAEARGVNIAGVTRMIQKLYKTTQTKTRTELVRWAIDTGYVSKYR